MRGHKYTVLDVENDLDPRNEYVHAVGVPRTVNASNVDDSVRSPKTPGFFMRFLNPKAIPKHIRLSSSNHAVRKRIDWRI